MISEEKDSSDFLENYRNIPKPEIVQRTLRIPELLEDVKRALRANALFSALALSLSLTAECASIEYPDEWFEEKADNDPYLMKQFPNYFNDNGVYLRKIGQGHDRERFEMWFDDWSNDHNCDAEIKENMVAFKKKIESHRRNKDGSISPELNGEVLYQIRCSLFHNGSNIIDFQSGKIRDIGNKNIKNFRYFLTNGNDQYLGMFGQSSSTNVDSADFNIYVSELVNGLCEYIEKYYKNKEPNLLKYINVYDNTGIYQ